MRGLPVLQELGLLVRADGGRLVEREDRAHRVLGHAATGSGLADQLAFGIGDRALSLWHVRHRQFGLQLVHQLGRRRSPVRKHAADGAGAIRLPVGVEHLLRLVAPRGEVGR